MAKKWRTTLVIGALLVAVGVAVIWALQPQPVPVDMARISTGPLEVTISQEGRTRVTDIYAVSAPIGGTLTRSQLHLGQEVRAGETIVASIRPPAPAFLDARTRAEALAAVAAADAAVRLARAQVQESEARTALAYSEYTRGAQLRQRDALSESQFEQLRIATTIADGQLAVAEATLLIRQREADAARARLIGPDTPTGPVNGECCVDVMAPVSGRVLAIHHESEQVIAGGAPLLEIGDIAELEIVVDLISSDAVRVTAGARAAIGGWGGEDLAATVRRLEPAGFTRVSALGIEEQRVRAILDLTPESHALSAGRLGHNYRVVADIIVERAEDAVLAPLSALFRNENEWAVFVVAEGGMAELRTVALGARTNRQAVILEGLSPGEYVILHPGDRVRDGVSVAPRERID
ncbi:efflux RND transporter periplasmic adaptor subunit [Pelagibacterium limicola]|uniref:efflux RND transporter periplasmic adaptor subunit n=1 Tax=Pelagibacterium limicola TaxID=2791022 RepID=UPI0018AF747C|nr:HlyD family efflux transporter periplasmic adaptor subunit [Pelagibacterium limicola]